jgi:hypothetical protein
VCLCVCDSLSVAGSVVGRLFLSLAVAGGVVDSKARWAAFFGAFSRLR